MKYRNRDGDIITATKIDDNHYKITSSFEGNIRTGFDTNPDDIIFIDFSGGPMINVGDNLGNWFNELKGLIVKSIKFDKGVLKFKWLIKVLWNGPCSYWYPIELINWYKQLPAYERFRYSRYLINRRKLEERIDSSMQRIHQMESDVKTSYELNCYMS
jgi:hypothetical protein